LWLRILVLVAFLLFTLGGGSTIGVLTAPGEWYAGLQKPAFNPPSWVFGPVWFLLYVLVGIAGWRVWQRRLGMAQRLWWTQIAVNFAWPVVFFSLHLVGLALAVVMLLLAAILAFVGVVWRQDRLSAWLFAPYAAWTAYATLLNAAIWWLN
jgi:translocator protein